MEYRLGPSTRLLALGDQGGPDLISALPDDLLLLVLARLPCAGAAARTGILSSRWRGLWARLRRIVLREVPFHSLEPALARITRPPPTVSLLKICLPKPHGSIPVEQAAAEISRHNSLLRAAALLDPEEFFLASPLGIGLELPCFQRATSIVLDLSSPVLGYGAYPYIDCLPVGNEFAALQMLSMSSCAIDSDALLSRCPQLHTLRLTDVCFVEDDLRVNLPLLQELVVAATWINHVNIVAPLLTQLTISLNSHQEGSISVFAPMVEKVSWNCGFSRSSSVFGLWQLMKLSLQTAQRQGQPPSLHICCTFE